LHKGTNFILDKTRDPEIIDKFLNTLASQLNGRSVHVFLNGGEPTISPVFEQIIDFIYEKKWCAYVNTNGSRSLDWWEKYAHKIYKVTVSYHPETVIDEEIFEKVKYISTQTNVGVFTLMYPPLWDKAVNAYNYFKDMGVTIAPSRVFKRNESTFDASYEYSQEQLDWLTNNSKTIFRDENSFAPPDNNWYGFTYIQDNTGNVEALDEVEFTNNRKNKFKGWHCNMGIDHIMINGQGLVSGAACEKAVRLGNLENFSKLATTSSICRHDYCMCTLDVQISKHKINE
jgi:organic radical activating enzyme